MLWVEGPLCDHSPSEGYLDGFQIGVIKNKASSETSLVVQWVRLHAPNARGPGLIPGLGTRSRMHAASIDPACCN